MHNPTDSKRVKSGLDPFPILVAQNQEKDGFLAAWK